MRTQQQDAPSRTVTITGSVTAAGAAQTGVGFTVTKGATGNYTLRFPGLRVVLAATASPLDGAVYIATVITQPNQVGVSVWSTTVAFYDFAFAFTVTGVPA